MDRTHEQPVMIKKPLARYNEELLSGKEVQSAEDDQHLMTMSMIDDIVRTEEGEKS